MALAGFVICFMLLITCTVSIYCQDIDLYEYPKSWDKPLDLNIDPPKPGWVDPFDMLGDSPYLHNHPYKQQHSSPIPRDFHHFQRIVNLFLRAVDLKNNGESSDPSVMVKLEMLITRKDLEILQDFGSNGEQKGTKLETVSNILDRLFAQNLSGNTPDRSFGRQILKGITKISLHLLKSPEWTVVISVSLMMFVTLWFSITHSYRLAVFTLILAIFFGGFGFTWMRMYEEKEAALYASLLKHGGDAPYHCGGAQLAWYEQLYYRAFGDDCKEYFKERYVPAIVKISPTEVFAETISGMFINPSSNIGKAYGGFIQGIVGGVPWYIKPLAVILGVILPVLLVMVILVFTFNYSVSLSVFGFSFAPAIFKRQILNPVKPGDQYIEDVSSVNLQNNPSILSENAPLFVMNWLGLQKILSSPESAAKINSGEINRTPDKQEKCDSVDEGNDRQENTIRISENQPKHDALTIKESYCKSTEGSSKRFDNHKSAGNELVIQDSYSEGKTQKKVNTCCSESSSTGIEVSRSIGDDCVVQDSHNDRQTQVKSDSRNTGISKEKTL